MNVTSIKSWIGQTTTGFAAAGGLATLGAALTHQITWSQAVVPLAGAVVLALWPENKSAATDVEAVVQALLPMIHTVFSHGVVAGSAVAKPTVVVTNPPVNEEHHT